MKKRILIAALLAASLTTAGVFAANGGSDTVGIHTDEDGTEVNTVKFNAKNEATAGDASVTPKMAGAKGEEYEFAGWATTKEKADKGISDFSASPEDLTNASLNAIGSGETKTVYAAYRVKKAARYLVQAYGIGQDDDENGNRMGITFGPAWASTSSTVYHDVDGDTTYQYQDEDDTSHHNVITGDDAGTTSADTDLGTEGGNAYRCLHFDNWKTIIYWNQKDPHVYDKCITKGCMRNLRLTSPGSEVQVNNWYGAIGGGNWISIENLRWGTEETANYAQSDVRAYLNGSDSESQKTVSEDESLLHAFPEELQEAIGKKAVTYAPDYKTTLTSNTVYDKLWLLSNHEIFGNSLRNDTDFAYSEGTAHSVVRPAQGGPQTNTKDLSLETGQYKAFADHDVMVTKKDYDYTDSNGNISAAVISADGLKDAGDINTRSLSPEGYSKVVFDESLLIGSFRADALTYYRVSPCFTLSRTAS